MPVTDRQSLSSRPEWSLYLLKARLQWLSGCTLVRASRRGRHCLQRAQREATKRFPSLRCEVSRIIERAAVR
jgi:Ser/Thr protein kinase RdoA (MazF antagonist)